MIFHREDTQSTTNTLTPQNSLVYCCSLRRSGEIGRRARLKIWWGRPRVGSSPTFGRFLKALNLNHPISLGNQKIKPWLLARGLRANDQHQRKPHKHRLLA